MAGQLLIEEVNDILDLHLASGDFDTLGGWVYSRIEMPPKINQKIINEGNEFTIEEVDNRRINRQGQILGGTGLTASGVEYTI